MVSKSSARRGGRAPKPATRQLPTRVFDMARYGGKWVATRRGEVVAVDETFAALETEIRRQGLQDQVILTHVPRKEDVFY